MIMHDCVSAKERLKFKMTKKEIISDIFFVLAFLSAFVLGGMYV
jgi:hypothetical protein